MPSQLPTTLLATPDPSRFSQGYNDLDAILKNQAEAKAAPLVASGQWDEAAQAAAKGGSVDLVKQIRALEGDQRTAAQAKMTEHASQVTRLANGFLPLSREERIRVATSPEFKQIMDIIAPGTSLEQIMPTIMDDAKLQVLASGSAERDVEEMFKAALGETEYKDGRLVHYQNRPGQAPTFTSEDLGPTQTEERQFQIQEEQNRLRGVEASGGADNPDEVDDETRRNELFVLKNAQNRFGLKLSQIEEAIAFTGPLNTGFITGGMDKRQEGDPQFHPQTQPSVNLGEKLKPISANVFFSELDNLRKQAAALGNRGSGLGQVTQREIDALEAVYVSLAQEQDQQELLRGLVKLAKQYVKVYDLIERQYTDFYGEDPDFTSTTQQYADYANYLEELIKKPNWRNQRRDDFLKRRKEGRVGPEGYSGGQSQQGSGRVRVWNPETGELE